jgi:hypothetical protein
MLESSELRAALLQQTLELIWSGAALPAVGARAELEEAEATEETSAAA